MALRRIRLTSVFSFFVCFILTDKEHCLDVCLAPGLGEEQKTAKTFLSASR